MSDFFDLRGNSRALLKGKSSFLVFILTVVSLIVAFLVAMNGPVVAFIFLFLFLGIGVFLRSIVNVEFGIYTIFICAFLIMGVYRVYDFNDIPIAMIVEILILAVFVGVLIQLQKTRGFKFNYSVVNVLIIIWLVYHFVQFINPAATSRIAWFYAVRNMVMIILVYFIFCIGIKTENFVKNIFKIWIGIVLVSAIYGIKQQIFGFAEFEEAWIHADSQRYGFLYTWGRIRRFSFFEGPMTFGVLLSYTSVLCFIFIGGPFRLRNKILLGIAGFIMLWAMMFTGTRTATALLPVGLVFYVIITFRPKIIAGFLIIMAIGTVLVIMPTNNPSLYIMRSAFQGTEDASMNVRLTNQERIQPYIQSHPFGWGIGSTGNWGAEFSPYTFIGTFAPDSEYVRIAIELGWIGLLLFCTLLFFILKSGIDNYFKVDDSRIKTYYLGVLTVTFMTIVAMYPQEAIRVHPLGILFALCIALLTQMASISYTKESKSNPILK